MSFELRIRADEIKILKRVLKIKRSITTNTLKNIMIKRIGSFWKVRDRKSGKLGNEIKEDKYQEKNGNIPIFSNRATVKTQFMESRYETKTTKDETD
jgi:hypothetical protein